MVDGYIYPCPCPCPDPYPYPYPYPSPDPCPDPDPDPDPCPYPAPDPCPSPDPYQSLFMAFQAAQDGSCLGGARDDLDGLGQKDFRHRYRQF